MAEFVTHYYGSHAAPFVTEFLTTLQSTARAEQPRMDLNPGPTAKFLTPTFVFDAEETLNSAVTAAANDGSEFVQRCALLRLGVWYVMLLRFQELRGFAKAQQPPRPWNWGATADGPLYQDFAQVYTTNNVTHLSEDGNDLLWLLRQIQSTSSASSSSWCRALRSACTWFSRTSGEVSIRSYHSPRMQQDNILRLASKNSVAELHISTHSNKTTDLALGPAFPQ